MTNDYGNLELHTVLLAAMKDIDKLCCDNGLRYYLHAGTLLGAVNHKGFIPWDDDVDIAMFREDYERFIKLVQEEYPDRYFLRNYLTDRTMGGNRSTLCVLGTEVYHIHEDRKSLHREICLDIVPLDAAPDSILLRKLQSDAVFFWDLIAQINMGSIIPHNPFLKMAAVLARMDRVKLGKRIDKLCMKYNGRNTECVGLLSYTGKNPYTGLSGYENDLLLRKWYEDPVRIPFEDTEFMTISEPEKDLDHRYGPHWREPYPEEKRVTKHDVKSYFISDEVKARVGL